MQDWMLILIVMCLVMLDVVILAVYTGLELSTGNGASRVANRENKMSVSGVSFHYETLNNSTLMIVLVMHARL